VSAVPAPADRRFRRAHVKPARGRRRLGRLKPLLLSIPALFLTAYGLYLGSTSLVHANVLPIASVVVRGHNRMSQGEVLALLAGLRGESLVWTDLSRWRQRLLASPWILDAELRRTLPSTVEVVISERHPIGIGRFGGELYLVDEEGTLIDQHGPRYADFDLPVIDGLSMPGSGQAALADPERAALASRVIAALDERPDIGHRLSQVWVSDPRNVQVVMSGDSALIALGDRDFLARLQNYLELAGALRERVSDIDYVDVRFDNRIYVRPTRPPAGRGPSRAAGSTAPAAAPATTGGVEAVQ
jgi:cell division protein FtsQ